jgi:hypothetical protein
MPRFAIILVCVTASLLAGILAYRFNCETKESAFQARFQQLRRDAHEDLKIGTTKEEALKFFSENHLQARSDESKAWGWVVLSRGCGRSLACSIGPDGGTISVVVSIDERGKVDSEPVVTEEYAGDCS